MEAGVLLAAAPEGVALLLRPSCCCSCDEEVREGKERGASSIEEKGAPSTRLSNLIRPGMMQL
jgi:hypothetical protein